MTATTHFALWSAIKKGYGAFHGFELNVAFWFKGKIPGGYWLARGVFLAAKLGVLGVIAYNWQYLLGTLLGFGIIGAVVGVFAFLVFLGRHGVDVDFTKGDDEFNKKYEMLFQDQAIQGCPPPGFDPIPPVQMDSSRFKK
jgi:hypothetical protein